uniref:Matrix AAA peptidase interacting protein 1 n=1 Tax=Erpetoichthys calabaricus TaxID=27687 RepID=A0A8C4TA32_ERPCA
MMALPMFRTCRAVCHLIKRPGCYWSLRLSAEKRNCFVPLEWSRHYCSQGDDISKNKQKVVVVGIPNPFIWFRTRIYYFLIRAYFDQEFRIDEFSDGAKQAFAHVSKLLSQCKFDALDGLVANDMLEKIKEKCRLLPTNHLQALAADLCDIMYSTPGDIGIYYDDNGRKFVSILMRFWYLTSAHIPEETPEGSKVFQVVFRDEGSVETRKLITANYEFQREFTQGVAPDWTITRIEHSRLLD